MLPGQSKSMKGIRHFVPWLSTKVWIVSYQIPFYHRADNSASVCRNLELPTPYINSERVDNSTYVDIGFQSGNLVLRHAAGKAAEKPGKVFLVCCTDLYYEPFMSD